MARVIADLQLHSRFSRAVSKAMTIPAIAAWARRKGIGLVATGDWTHPMWFREIERDLEELGNGLLKLKHDGASSDAILQPKFETHDPLFLLASEVSCIYSQNGKGRRIHTLIWVPSLASARDISKEMTKRGCNLLSDGRPIIGLTSIQVAELVLTIEPKALVIPAHCLLPDSMILGERFIPKRIDAVEVGERVVTHSGTFHKVIEVKKRFYTGNVFHIRPWYFRPGLVTTPEHPYYAIQTIKKCPSTGDICRPSRSHLALCKRKGCLRYVPAWIQAKYLAVGDVLVYPRSRVLTYQSDMVLDGTSEEHGTIHAGGTRGRRRRNTIPMTPGLGRLIGYYLAEGSTDGDNSFSFCFAEHEQDFIDDVIRLTAEIFGIDHVRVYRRPQSKAREVIFYSKLHAQLFARKCYGESQRHIASAKIIPAEILEADESVQAECLRGWYRGDHGYTTSRMLMNQMKAICLRLGIIPSVHVETVRDHARRGKHEYKGRVIRANYDVYHFNNFSFFENAFDLKKEIPRSQTKLDRKHGWMDERNVYLPIKEITQKDYGGEVYNLEVETDHSYVTEFSAVHNCWTPWFSVFGSMSGFNSIDEAFGPYAKYIYAVETGLSSNPSMNWQIHELDTRSIVSFSDAHSGAKLGREATVFEIPGELGYDAVYDAIRGSSEAHAPHIAYTIEFHPEEGKYHWSGHRSCRVRRSPRDTATNGATCPVCGKSLTQGVEQRVGELAGRSEEDLKLEMFERPLSNAASIRMTRSTAFPKRPPFVMLVPLIETIAEALGTSVVSKKVQALYFRLTDEVGTEFFVLMEASIDAIAHVAGERVAEGVRRVRSGDLVIDPGYDGVFGVVKIWNDGGKGIADSGKEQLTLLS